ncbi:MAG: tetratricopeptide repeat protein [Bacteroidetes bacterium]|nr:tetratricopeptide repeat protein [Bacteroidota bacterium]
MKIKNKKQASSTIRSEKQVSQGLPAFNNDNIDRKKNSIVALILVVTFLSFLPSLHNDLNKTWDDQSYVTNNTQIRSLSFENIKRVFMEDGYHYPNYHPFCTLSLAVNYHFSGLGPAGYHYTNLLLHLLNTLLVFVFIYVLTGRRIVTAAVTSLLFGLLPVHVESVAWISERKDVLYTFFFLLSLISYQYFIRDNNRKFYFLTILFFLCSLLSKAMAASLPLVLLLIDHYMKREWSKKNLFEKVPFVILSIAFGLLAMYIQSEYGALVKGPDLPVFRRLLHACYGFVEYIPKIIVPSGLSAFYPYPYPFRNGSSVMNQVPLILYITFVITLLIAAFIVYNIIKKRKYSAIIVFGVFFYTITIALVLQFFPVGSAIMADRYAYIPSIGLLFVIGEFFTIGYNNPKYKVIVIVGLCIYSVFLFGMTYERCKVWKNDETIWTDVLNKYPNDSRVSIALKNRAIYYMDISNYPAALNDFNAYLQSNPGDADALDKAGKIYAQKLNDTDRALAYFQAGYQINPLNVDVVYDLAIIYGVKGDYTNSLNYFLKVMELKGGGDSQLYQYIGNCYRNLGQAEKAKAFFDKAGVK